jgi:hypothetical protein
MGYSIMPPFNIEDVGEHVSFMFKNLATPIKIYIKWIYVLTGTAVHLFLICVYRLLIELSKWENLNLKKLIYLQNLKLLDGW